MLIQKKNVKRKLKIMKTKFLYFACFCFALFGVYYCGYHVGKLETKNELEFKYSYLTPIENDSSLYINNSLLWKNVALLTLLNNKEYVKELENTKLACETCSKKELVSEIKRALFHDGMCHMINSSYTIDDSRNMYYILKMMKLLSNDESFNIYPDIEKRRKNINISRIKELMLENSSIEFKCFKSVLLPNVYESVLKYVQKEYKRRSIYENQIDAGFRDIFNNEDVIDIIKSIEFKKNSFSSDTNHAQ